MQGFNGVDLLMQSLRGIEADFEHEAGGEMAALVFGLAQTEIPVDSGHMQKSTGFKEVGGTFVLYTNTSYAYDQYSRNRYHLREGGAYKSISSVPMDFDDETRSVLESTRGSASAKASYWYKYQKLRESGALKKSTPRWFHEAARRSQSLYFHQSQQSFLKVARARAKRSKR